MQRETSAKRAKWEQTNMLSNKRGCPRRTNVGLDGVSIVPWDWSMEDTCSIKKIPIRDSGSRVSKMGVNPHKIVGIRLVDISKQGLMHKHVGKRAKMQRSKESQVAQSKQGKHNIITQSGERCVSSTPTSQRCVSQAVTSNKP